MSANYWLGVMHPGGIRNRAFVDNARRSLQMKSMRPGYFAISEICTLTCEVEYHAGLPDVLYVLGQPSSVFRFDE